AVVTLVPGPGGAVTAEDQARCSCLLAPRCLHRAAVLGCCPLADPAAAPDTPSESPESGTGAESAAPVAEDASAEPEPAEPVTQAPAEAAAAAGLW
ncbi:SWIM zinc finger family protein, partial [Kitasatospora paracochleata]|uniref:SWIM zinc finger family protein n=1 Tax=Kitasatospora paracochleata TaxID=58354 RepID=UPI0031DD8BAF